MQMAVGNTGVEGSRDAARSSGLLHMIIVHYYLMRDRTIRAVMAFPTEKPDFRLRWADSFFLEKVSCGGDMETV